jgi:hypothetical protein
MSCTIDRGDFPPWPGSITTPPETPGNVVDVKAIVDHHLKPILAGHPPEAQGAALADCVALWLAGHHVPGDESATRKMRAELLADFCFCVRQLVPINANILGTTP